MRVFIEATAGAMEKGRYDEATFVRKDSRKVLLPYPWPYGFVPGSSGASGDGECLDCYIVTDRPLAEGDFVEAEVIGLLEFFEDDEADHKLLAVLPGDPVPDLAAVKARLEAFILGISAAWPDMRVRVGAVLPREAALARPPSRSRAIRVPERARVRPPRVSAADCADFRRRKNSYNLLPNLRQSAKSAAHSSLLRHQAFHVPGYAT